MAALDDALAALEQEVAEQEAGVDSGITFIQGLIAIIVQLRAELANLGATPEQLAKVDELKNRLDAKQQALAAALAANPNP